MGRNSFAAGAKVSEEFGSPVHARSSWTSYNVRGQGIGAELIAEQWEIPRSELDELAVESHRKAAQRHRERAGSRARSSPSDQRHRSPTDQGIRPDTTLEALSQLKPAFKPDGRITAGNSSQISDGAAAVLLMSREKADALGLTPRARIVDHDAVGCDPVKMLEGPIPATREDPRAQRDRRSPTSTTSRSTRRSRRSSPPGGASTSPDMARVNPRGGAMALGHPLGSTGARLITTLLHELEDDDKELGLVTMCCGGGLGHRHADPAHLTMRRTIFEPEHDDFRESVRGFLTQGGRAQDARSGRPRASSTAASGARRRRRASSPSPRPRSTAGSGSRTSASTRSSTRRCAYTGAVTRQLRARQRHRRAVPART